MDKKNTLIGIVLLVAAFGIMFYQSQQLQEQQLRERQQAEAQAAEANSVSSVSEEGERFTDVETESPSMASDEQESGASDSKGLFAKASAEEKTVTIAKPAHLAKEETYVLENDYIRVTFTSHGGAVSDVAFIHRDANGVLDYADELGSDNPYVFNLNSSLPALAIGLAAGEDVPEEFAPAYRMAKQSEDSIVFIYDSPDGGRIVRGYKIKTEPEAGDPYVIEHESRFVNNGKDVLNITNIFVNLGEVPPTQGDIYGQNQNFGYFDGENSEFIGTDKLVGSKGVFLGIGSSAPIWQMHNPRDVENLRWLSIKNQFFAGVLTPHPQQLATGFFIDAVELGTTDETGEPAYALRGRAKFNLGKLPVGKEKVLSMDYYCGPKEYSRLSKLGSEQDRLMQLAPDFFFVRHFASISKLLLNLMLWLNAFIPNWGLTIIVTTIIIKAVMWPLTAVQVRSAKRMSKIQAPLAEIREKYKDNQTVMQQKTMELFKQHRVNPAAGCLPLFIQMPIFLSLFYTLRTASELRFSPFLWVEDLSVADSLSFLPALPDWIPFFGGPIHILPFLMAITMVFQMRMTPTPTTDNMQRKLFQFMPVVFLLFCYAFPAGLVLYWTCQNLLTILQQWLTNRSKDEEVIQEAVPMAAGPKEQKKERLSAPKQNFTRKKKR